MFTSQTETSERRSSFVFTYTIIVVVCVGFPFVARCNLYCTEYHYCYHDKIESIMIIIVITFVVVVVVVVVGGVVVVTRENDRSAVIDEHVPLGRECDRRWRQAMLVGRWGGTAGRCRRSRTPKYGTFRAILFAGSISNIIFYVSDVGRGPWAWIDTIIMLFHYRNNIILIVWHRDAHPYRSAAAHCTIAQNHFRFYSTTVLSVLCTTVAVCAIRHLLTHIICNTIWLVINWVFNILLFNRAYHDY